MAIWQHRCHLRKLTITCLISFVIILVTILVNHAPIFQQEELLLGPFKSTCSHAADRRGPNQKIVTYSLYGNFSREDHVQKYVIPFGETLKSVPSIYPGINQYEHHSNDSNKGDKWCPIHFFRVDCKDLSQSAIRRQGKLGNFQPPFGHRKSRRYLQRHPSAGKSKFRKESKCGDLALGKILS